MNKSFTIAALVACASASYQDYTVTIDGGPQKKHFRSQDWSSVDVDYSDYRAHVPTNNSIMLKNQPWDGPENVLKPAIRGGALQYTVDLSNFGCGCVAGVYAVAVNDFCNNEDGMTTNNPQCASIDIMQANPYGFNVAAHPCSNGTCDARSQCEYNMRKEGAEKYGEGAYGPGGSRVNTDYPFTVKTEFVSTRDYQELHKLRTRITQDNREIMLESDCQDYINGLDANIEGGMGIVISSWDNSDVGAADFECPEACPAPAGSCANATNVVSDFKIFQWGYTEDKEERDDEEEEDERDDEEEDERDDEDEEDERTPAQFEGFVGFSDDIGGSWEFFVKGLDNQHLKTEDDCIEIGQNNKAFVLDYPMDDSTWWSYKHKYAGGSVAFDVDVSEVGCACAAGVYLAKVDDVQCGWDAYDQGVTPQCGTVDLMEANIWGFNTQSLPCEFGECEAQSQCRRKASDDDHMAYGPGSDYKIDSTKSFRVKSEFWTNKDDEGETTDVTSIKTIITQNGMEIILEQDCDDYLDGLNWQLDRHMSLGISSYSVGQENDISGDSCSTACETANTKIKNIVWTTNDCINSEENEEEEEEEQEPGELVIGDAAESLEMCEEGCSECRMSWFENFPNDKFATCSDMRQMKFGGKCGGRKDKSMCATGDGLYCHMSYPYGDADKMRSDDAGCRTVPADYIENDFKYGNRECRNSKAQLCFYGCGDGTCHNSWPIEDPLKWKSPMAMCRCKN